MHPNFARRTRLNNGPKRRLVLKLTRVAQHAGADRAGVLLLAAKPANHDVVVIENGEIFAVEQPRIAYRSSRNPEFLWREVDSESDRGEKVVRI